MTSETQQKILGALNQMVVDLDLWIKARGGTTDGLGRIYDAIVQENGMAARLVASLTASVFPLAAKVDVRPHSFAEERGRVGSKEFADWLLALPEPAPDELNHLLTGLKDALPNLRKHFSESAKPGPQRRRGGRPKELDNPETRKEICAKIKTLRGPNTNLKDIFKRVAREYESSHSLYKRSVSPTTIKRIWLECEEKNDENL